MTELTELDRILYYIVSNTVNIERHTVHDMYQTYIEYVITDKEIPPCELLEVIVKKLIKDGFIDEYTPFNTDDMGISIHSYSATFEGVIFSKQGGYTNQKQRLIISNNLKKLTTGTVALGSIGLCLIESIKYWKWVGTIELWTSFCLLMALSISIGIVWLIILELSERIYKQ